LISDREPLARRLEPPPKPRWHPVKLPERLRSQHLYVLGATGAGKTNFLTRLIREDINAGRGLAVFAREDDWLRTQLMPAIPDARLDDVVYFNPADTECPVTFNPLTVEGAANVGLKVDETFAVFQRVLAFTGARMEPVLRHTLRALVERPGSTLKDVIRLLDRDDSRLRNQVIRSCSDEFTVRFFERTYPRLPRDAFEPIVLRIGLARQGIRPSGALQPAFVARPPRSDGPGQDRALQPI
jgi:hypothetical protein